MSIQAVDSVIRRQFGNRIRKLILLTLADFADEHGRSWPAVETIAFRAECSVRAAQQALADLADAGLIRLDRHAGRQNTNLYTLQFQNFPPPPEPRKKGAAPAPPPADDDVKGAAHDIKGANPGRPSAPEPSGTVKEPRERTASQTAPPPDPIVQALADAYPDAPPALSPIEVNLLAQVHLHLTDLQPDDWLALGAWNRAPDRIRGRSLWPRSRREFLENMFEAVEHIRKWWRKDGRRWHQRTSAPASRPKAPPPAPTGNEISTAEALAILQQ